MAKKTPVKKSRRRLKRSVRRSLSAVLMITAIGVAAIPVPENRASSPGIMTIASEGDVHIKDNGDEEYSFVSGHENEPMDNSIKLDTKKDDTIEDLMKDSSVYKSMVINDLGSGQWDLSWQFMYYLVTNKASGEEQGVICRYNSQYRTGEVDLNLTPITEYYTVDAWKYDAFYDADYDLEVTDSKGDRKKRTHDDGMKGMDSDMDPTQPVTYTYEEWRNTGGNEELGGKDVAFFKKYFGTAYASGVRSYETYKQQKDAYDALSPENQATTAEPSKPVDLSVVPADSLSTEQKLTYYCDYDANLNPNGSGYSLVSVLDSLHTENGNSSYIYVAWGGNPTAISKPNDPNGFKVTEIGVKMCAIGDKAFEGVQNVDVMTIPEQIGYIGDEAFKSSFIKEINITNVKYIGNRAFQQCMELAKVTIQPGTITIGAECFAGSAISDLTLPYSIGTIGYGAFANCNKLTSLNLNGITSECQVHEAAFYNCTSLTSIAMADSHIISLGKAVFAVDSGASPLSIVLPQQIKDIVDGENGLGEWLFSGRFDLQNVVFPQGYGRTRGTSVKIPSNMFHNCSNLQYVEFPVSINGKNDSAACGFLSYDSDKLFADVINPDFYVRGPEKNALGEDAVPRTKTWDAKTAANDFVPYVFKNSEGVDCYEVAKGGYRYQANEKGELTSCVLVGEETDGNLVIPSKVGNYTIRSVVPGCFNDEKLRDSIRTITVEDNSVSSIGDGVFEGLPNLKKVTIGNSVNVIGNRAFADCHQLTDVTFHSPSNGYEGFAIGTDAFKTESEQLTFHGDIVEGYAPFDWAMKPDNIIKSDGLRVCYKSLAPTFLTVMYNPITDMVTLLDYPKYSEIDTILNEEYAEERGILSYNEWRQQNLYIQYRNPTYDVNRYAFAEKWNDPAQDKEALYADDTYGPWITPDFCDFVEGSHFDEWFENFGKDTQKDWQKADEVWTAAANGIADFFFEPIVSYAADKPTAYYDKYPFVVTQAVDSDNPFFPTTAEEEMLVYNTKNIDIPAGVDSIDVFGYAHNLTVDGEKNESVAANNTANLSTYLKNYSDSSGWTLDSQEMYDGHLKRDEADDIDIVSGLFSGYYEDGDAARSENRLRGNDVIRSVTMHSVKYLPDYAFDSCEGLEYVILGDDCADIGIAPFRGCYAMTLVGGNDYYTSDNGIIYSNNTDGSYTIEECLAGRGRAVGPGSVNVLSDENIKNVSAIKPGAFEDCDFLTEVNFGSSDTAGLQEIPEDCFRNCNILSKVTLPMTVNDIGPNAFVGANSLNELVVYGKEVKISGRAFRNEKDESGRDERARTTVRAYEDSAVARYVKEYGDEYNLFIDEVNPLGEIWQVSFYDPNYVLIEDLKDQSGNPLDNPQYVEDGARATEPAAPVMEGWTFERWVGSNNVDLGKPIHEDSFFYAQGFSESGMVNGKYPVEFYDGVDGKQVGPTQYIDPGKDAIAPGHPVHTGYEADGYSDTYTNIQMAKTIVLKYKAVSTSGSSTGGTQTPGNTSNRTSSSNNTTSNTSNTSTTSSSTGSTSASTIGMHVVTVNGGSGSGTYATGATVLITANTPAAGSVFSKWTTTSQGVSLANVSATPTTFSMPANDVVITAEFTAAAAPVANTGSNAVNTNNNDSGSTRVDITKQGISNKDLASANVNGSTDNFVIKITETDEATNAVREALTNKYGSLDNILYYAMDISLYDSTGTVKLTDTSGITVDITIPIPDALVTYGGNNMAGAVINGNQLENLNENFTTINGVPCIRFTATHFSPYTVYVDTGNLTEGMLDTTPKTGDPIHPKWFLSIGLACLSVILFMKKDKGAKVKTA